MKDKVALQARRNLKRDKIIENCCKAFAKLGIESTSITHLCEAAKVNPKVMYDYFDSKDEIVVACAKRNIEAIHLRLRKYVESKGDLYEDLNKMIAEFYSARHELRFLYQVIVSPSYAKKLASVVKDLRNNYEVLKNMIAKDLKVPYSYVDMVFCAAVGVIDYYCLTGDEHYIEVAKILLYNVINSLLNGTLKIEDISNFKHAID